MTLIYRSVLRGAKEFSLHRERDYYTGLSFLSYPYGSDYACFDVLTLHQAGFVVVADGGQVAKNLSFWGSTPFIYYDDVVFYPEGHHTVYHPDITYWQEWYKADLKNWQTPYISSYLQSFYELRSLVCEE